MTSASGMRPGSSPLTRGKRPTVDGDLDLVRLIPAHAGKTGRASQAWTAPAAHPRSRGENATNLAKAAQVAGSSPLTRGKRTRRDRLRRFPRLIPAHAGKTRRRRVGGNDDRAHPRSRGENTICAIVYRPRTGSSPLTRGKRAHADRVPSSVRLIPAHAGKTGPRGMLTCPRPAHPRSRGENTGIIGTRLRPLGSSPLTRGKRPLAVS